jgi:hypothetical protein
MRWGNKRCVRTPLAAALCFRKVASTRFFCTRVSSLNEMAMSDLRDQRGRPPKPNVQAKAIAASATTAMMSGVNECATSNIPDRAAARGHGPRLQRLIAQRASYSAENICERVWFAVSRLSVVKRPPVAGPQHNAIGD